MALRYIEPPQEDRSTTLARWGLEQMAASLNQLAGMQDRRLAGEALFGREGAGFGNLTKQHAPGLDPKLAGPSLAMTKDAMARSGIMNGGSWRDLSGEERRAVGSVFGGSNPMQQGFLARPLMGSGFG